MLNDLVSDMLARIRNAYMIKSKNTNVLYSKVNIGILNIMKKEGYISDYKEVDVRKGVKEITVTLKYLGTSSVINKIERVSKPSQRIYLKSEDLKGVIGGLGIYILSTSKGVISDYEAKVNNIGGEVLCKVY